MWIPWPCTLKKHNYTCICAIRHAYYEEASSLAKVPIRFSQERSGSEPWLAKMTKKRTTITGRRLFHPWNNDVVMWRPGERFSHPNTDDGEWTPQKVLLIQPPNPLESCRMPKENNANNISPNSEWKAFGSLLSFIHVVYFHFPFHKLG